jgi:hypothetical protein
MDDARVVMDTIGSTRPALLGDTEGRPLVMLFSATYPERATRDYRYHLVTFGRYLAQHLAGVRK